MDLLPDDDQQGLADAFARAARELFPLEAELRMASTEQWREIAGLGWIGAMTDAACGGSGLGLAEAALLFREIGRQLVPGPLLSSVLAARFAARIGESALAASIVAGECRVALLAAPDARSLERRLRLIDGKDAEFGLLLTPDEASLHTLPKARAAANSMDPSVSLEYCELTAPPRAVIAREELDLFSEALVLMAASASGLCEATRDQSAAYARMREQFGRPIGSFQAVSHRCADMAARAEVAWLQVVMAALSHAEGFADARFQTDAARLVAVDAAIANAGDNVQNHGGMGFTQELPPHRFVKRAFLLDRLFGGRRATLDRILGAPAAIVRGELRAA